MRLVVCVHSPYPLAVCSKLRELSTSPISLGLEIGIAPSKVVNIGLQ
jgi:hypothetical protein